MSAIISVARLISVGAGCHGAGESPARRLRHASVDLKVGTCGSVRVRMPTVRSARPARVSCASIAANWRSQPLAPAQEPSSTIKIGPLPCSVSACGFSTGPARPIMIAATASIRSKSSHHGVRSVVLSSSASPSKSATPGKRRRMGAGGTARRISQRIGNASRASNSQGAVKPIPPKTLMPHSPAARPARQRATAAPIVPRHPCGATHSATRCERKVAATRLCALPAGRDSGRAGRSP